ncbi:MAG: putative toxin-antitoxin system toxin component, PIN family [Elusimicrobia bacterium]|nr:putative toxin-antitoxin system toxin component, PIN family [Elusimicrobiota bacterium]
MRIVFDSNILVAAFATRGLCNEIFELCLVQHQIFLSGGILQEVKKTLGVKIHLPEKRVQEIIKFLQSKTTLVQPSECDKKQCRDPNDLFVLGTAASARADLLISGDHDLLILKQYGNTKIVTPRESLEFMK